MPCVAMADVLCRQGEDGAAKRRYHRRMNLWETLRSRFGAIASIVALLAWFAMLWFMFGDVL